MPWKALYPTRLVCWALWATRPHRRAGKRDRQTSLTVSLDDSALDRLAAKLADVINDGAVLYSMTRWADGLKAKRTIIKYVNSNGASIILFQGHYLIRSDLCDFAWNEP